MPPFLAGFVIFATLAELLVPARLFAIEMPAHVAGSFPGVLPDAVAAIVRNHALSIGAVLLAALLLNAARFIPRAQWALVALSVLLGFRYLHWRLDALNTASIAGTTISLILYAAEVYGIVAVVLFYVQVAKPTKRSPPAPDENALPTVDVWVTIYDESPQVLYKTLVACAAMDYPKDLKRVYVLDDGNRGEVRGIAEALGCRYLSRTTNEHAKAGNLNHALRLTSGDLIMVLDCDHIPVRSFLKETVGFFRDPKVAVVQTPHYFYNPDTFQRNLRLEREIVNEQDLFFYVIEPGRDGFNSSFFAGSGGVFRRTPLVEIGGFQVITLTEDLHTTMVLHSKGHRSVYLNKILVAGLAPESYRSYLKQRQRWCRGGVQVFLLDNPLIKRGLSLMQRLNYFGSIVYFFHGWARLVYLTAPLSLLLFGIPPLIAAWPVLLNYFLPYYFASLMAFGLISGRYRNPFWSDVYETVMSFSISWTAVETILFPRKIKFHVTPKGERFDKPFLDWPAVSPHLLLFALLLIGLGIAAHGLMTRPADSDALIVSGFWCVYNLVMVATAVIVARERPQKRTSSRLARRIYCELRHEHGSFIGRTSDISETGLSLTVDQPVNLPGTLWIRLIGDFGEATDVRGEVIRNDLLPSGVSTIGVRFLNVTDPQLQSLIRQMYSSPAAWETVPRREYGSLRSFFFILTSWSHLLVRERIFRRHSPRIHKNLRCELVGGDRIYKGTTEDVSTTGLSVRLDANEVPPKGVTAFLYQEERLLFSVRSEIVRSRKSGGGSLVLGIRFMETKDLIFTALNQL